MTGQQMVQLVCTTILMITVVIAGIFGTDISSRWLKNRREERIANSREETKWIRTMYDKERESWLAILAEKDRELESLEQSVKRLEKNLDIATRVLGAAEKKGAEE